jgi:hypothetical protein
MSSVVFGHRDEENDPEIMLLTCSLQVDLRKDSDIVNPSHPVLPFEDINRVFSEPEKGQKVRRNRLSALEDSRERMRSGYDVHNMRVEEIAGR